MPKNECFNRHNLIEQLKLEVPSKISAIYLFIGKRGTGKKYVLNELEKVFIKNYRIYTIIEDSIIEKNKKRSKYTWKVSLNLGVYAGISLTPQINDSTKINYIIQSLKSLVSRKDIIIVVTDYDILCPESRDFILTLIKHIDLIKERLKRKIIIFITGTQNFFEENSAIEKIFFSDYTLNDIHNYLINYLNYSEDNLNPQKVRQLYECFILGKHTARNGVAGISPPRREFQKC